MGQVYNGVASEYEMPREPRFYNTESIGSLPKTNCNISICKDDRICDTCVKADVCMLSSELHKAINDIKDISERTDVFIDVTIKCQKWAGKVINSRG